MFLDGVWSCVSAKAAGLKGESPGAARMLCNDSSAWEKEAGGNCPEWQEEREKVGE